MPHPKILVADDDRDMVKIVGMMLRRAGYEVIFAVDGCQAMDAACKLQPDLLILDVNMPAGTGISIQERLQNVATMCTCPVIYLTGDKSRKIVERATRLGADAVLYKPFDGPELLNAVKKALHEQHVPVAAVRDPMQAI